MGSINVHTFFQIPLLILAHKMCIRDRNNAVLTVTLADGPIHGRNFGDGYYRFTAETGYTGIADIGPYLRVTLNATNELFAGN